MATIASVMALGGALALNFVEKVSINLGNWSAGTTRLIPVWTRSVHPAAMSSPSLDTPVISNKWRMAASLAGSNFTGGVAGAAASGLAAGCPGVGGAGVFWAAA